MKVKRGYANSRELADDIYITLLNRTADVIAQTGDEYGFLKVLHMADEFQPKHSDGWYTDKLCTLSIIKNESGYHEYHVMNITMRHIEEERGDMYHVGCRYENIYAIVRIRPHTLNNEETRFNELQVFLKVDGVQVKPIEFMKIPKTDPKREIMGILLDIMERYLDDGHVGIRMDLDDIIYDDEEED